MKVKQDMDHQEFIAAHAAAVAETAAKHRAEIDRGEAIAAAAKDALHWESRAAELAHASAANARVAAYQRWAAEAYREAVAAYTANPTRPAIAALAAALLAVEAEGERTIGQPQEGSHGPPQELLYALAAAKIATSPAAAARLSLGANYNVGDTGARYNQAVRSLRAGSLVEASLHLAAVEAGIETIANQGRAGAGDGAERWEAFRFGGSLQHREDALSVIEAADFVKKHGTPEERARYHGAVSDAVARKDPGESFESVVRRVRAGLAATVTKVVDAIDPPPAPRKSKRASDDADADAAAEHPNDHKPAAFAGFV